jgi:hypothetical protein
MPSESQTGRIDSAKHINVVRTEPAHQEAYVHLGTATVTAAQWQVVSEALHTWGVQQHRQPADLGVRVTFLATPP